MKYVKQFGIIIIVSFLAEILNQVIPIPVPASIYGLVLMLAGLILSTAYLVDGTYNPFLYFRF